jgi:putative ABC transport system permease protein
MARKRRMSLSDVRYLYHARMRRKAVLAQELFAVLGIAVGVALLFASQVASTSLARSVKELTNEIVGDASEFQLDARGTDGFDERLLGEVQRLPSVPTLRAGQWPSLAALLCAAARRSASGCAARSAG